MVPSLGLGGRNLIMIPGLFPSLRVRDETGMKSETSRSLGSAVDSVDEHHCLISKKVDHHECHENDFSDESDVKKVEYISRFTVYFEWKDSNTEKIRELVV
jgi:hypothetical protein